MQADQPDDKRDRDLLEDTEVARIFSPGKVERKTPTGRYREPDEIEQENAITRMRSAKRFTESEIGHGATNPSGRLRSEAEKKADKSRSSKQIRYRDGYDREDF